MVYPMGGTIDGQHAYQVFARADFLYAADIDRIVQRLGDAIEAALVSTGSAAPST